MIYLDNAATTLHKPGAVYKAVNRAMRTCANPGRGGHRASLAAAQTVFQCREAAAELFGLTEPERIVFTRNATEALNLAIKNTLHGGGHAVISGYEHNSVVRPLEAMRADGVTYTAAYSPLFDQSKAYEAVRDAIRWDTKCVIINHVSKVFGFILPVKRIDELCKSRNIPLILDASQSAGILDINAAEYDSLSFICCPGHKGLYGPQGTGILACCKEYEPYSIIQGGTGSNSMETEQPDFLPDIFESGTLNTPGIAGLYEGIKFVSGGASAELYRHERRLLERLARNLESIKGITVYHDASCQIGVLSFTSDKLDPDTLCELLSEKGFCLRGGMHCAPLAHRSAGTLPHGTVRASFSAFNRLRDADSLTQTLKFCLI